MIIKGASRSNGIQLGQYLAGLIGHENDRITVLAVDHLSGDLMTATRDMQAATNSGQRGHKGLYHAQISPAPGEDQDMTAADWKRCADVLAEKLGLEGQPRVLVLHEKDGRTHLHVAWQRYDYEHGHLRSDSWTYPEHERAARQLEEELGHQPQKGPHLDGEEHRSDQSYDMSEAEQTRRAKRNPDQLCAFLASAWTQSDTPQSFIDNLADDNLLLAKGSRRAFVLVDEAGEVYSLSRFLRGTANAKDIKSRLSSLDDRLYPTLEEARDMQRKMHQSDRLSQKADTLARQQAGERLRIKDQQRQKFAALQRQQKKDLVNHETEASARLDQQRQDDKPPGMVYSFFLRVLGRYDQTMSDHNSRDRQRLEDIAADRAALIDAQKETRDQFKAELKKERHALATDQLRARSELTEREQSLFSDRVDHYLDLYQNNDNKSQDDGEDDPPGREILPPQDDAPQKAKMPSQGDDLDRDPDDPPGKEILPPEDDDDLPDPPDRGPNQSRDKNRGGR